MEVDYKLMLPQLIYLPYAPSNLYNPKHFPLMLLIIILKT